MAMFSYLQSPYALAASLLRQQVVLQPNQPCSRHADTQHSSRRSTSLRQTERGRRQPNTNVAVEKEGIEIDEMANADGSASWCRHPRPCLSIYMYRASSRAISPRDHSVYISFANFLH